MSWKCLVIGLGNIGMGYDIEIEDLNIIQTHCRAIELHPAFVLVGAVDPSEALQIEFYKKYKKPVFKQIEEALVMLNADIYIIACPTHLHYSTLTKILDSTSPKVIICEKPLSYDLNEAEAMLKLCNERDVKLLVNYIRRSDLGAIEIKRKIDVEEIQSPIKGICYYSKGFLHNGSHFLNLLKYWLGEVKQFKELSKGKQLNQFDAEPDVYVSFEKGDVIFMSTWDQEMPYHAIELVSKSGKLLYLDGGELIEWRARGNFDSILPISNSMNVYQWQVYDNIWKMLSGKASCELCEAQEGFETVKDIKEMLNL